jgi:PBP1b-binding outer membrane lipoprotein LpoB
MLNPLILTRTSLTIATISLMALTGCSSAPTETASPEAINTTIPVAKATNAAKGAASAMTYNAISGVVDQTIAAVNTGDMAAAKTAFEGFEAGWKPVEDALKAKDKAAYAAVEDGMGAVESAIGSGSKDKALAALTALKTTIGGL